MSEMAAGLIGQYGGASMDTWICKNCELKYDEKEEQCWLICCMCECTYDTACLGIPKCHHTTLKKRKDAFWLCPTCHPKFRKADLTRPRDVEDVVYNRDDDIKYIRASTTELLAQQKNLENTIRSIEEKIKNSEGMDTTKMMDNMKHTIQEEVPKMWSEVVKKSPPQQANVTVENIRKALTEVANQEKDQEIRSRGIVVYRLAESERISAEDKKREDEEAIRELLAFIKCDEATVTHVDRLGRYDEEKIREGKYRPVKVRFSQKEERDKVLNNLHRLKNAPEGIKVLSIRQDLNEMQRKELRDKMTQAITLTRASPTTFYRVKGEPGNYRLVELEKK